MKMILNFSECIISFFSLCLLCVVFSCDEMDIDPSYFSVSMN